MFCRWFVNEILMWWGRAPLLSLCQIKLKVMKKQIEVKLLHLNELGVNELNEYFVSEGVFDRVFTTDDCPLNSRKKRVKDVKNFSSESHVVHYDGFDLQIKHFVCEVYEVEVVETIRKITL